MTTSTTRIIEIIVHDFNGIAHSEPPHDHIIRPYDHIIATWIRKWYRNHISIKEVKRALNTREAHKRLWINSTRAVDYVDGVKTEKEIASEAWFYALH